MMVSWEERVWKVEISKCVLLCQKKSENISTGRYPLTESVKQKVVIAGRRSEAVSGHDRFGASPCACGAFAEVALDKLLKTKGMFEMISLTEKALRYEYEYILK